MKQFKGLEDNIHEIVEFLAFADKNLEEFKGLIIDRRKPHTERVFFILPDTDLRVCLHKFSACKEDECFAHPHSWPAQIGILKGKYKHFIHTDVPLHLKSSISACYESSILAPNSLYTINEPTTWHKVHPITDCMSIMVNGPAWYEYSDFCTFTAGKELVELTKEEISEYIKEFTLLLVDFEKAIS